MDNNAHISRFYDVAEAAFERAAAASGGVEERHFAIGPAIVTLRFAGRALQPLILPALAHLATPWRAAARSLTVSLFDSESTGTPMPPPAWTPDSYGARGEIIGFNTDRFRTIYAHGVDLLQMMDLERERAVFWAPSYRIIPYFEIGGPLRAILHWWMWREPYQPLHAGAVGLETGGVLLAGKRGSGKSTSTLACLAGGLLYAGDDYVLAGGQDPFVYSLYNTAKLVPDNLHRFPQFEPAIRNRERLGEEKAMIFVHEAFPARISAGFPIRAVLLPKVTGERDTRLKRTSPMSALLALAPTTILHMAGASQEAFEKMSRLVKQTPCYVLEAGTDLPQIPAVVRELLETGRAS
jgi:hypothetical protein